MANATGSWGGMDVLENVIHDPKEMLKSHEINLLAGQMILSAPENGIYTFMIKSSNGDLLLQGRYTFSSDKSGGDVLHYANIRDIGELRSFFSDMDAFRLAHLFQQDLSLVEA
ncbi:MAG: hypothetical protein ABIM99_06110 [Candidatus Dojkabacteria bacterium]